MIKKKNRLFSAFALGTLALGMMLPFGENIAEISRDTTNNIVQNEEGSGGDTYYSGGGGAALPSEKGGARNLPGSVTTITPNVTTWAEAFPDANLRTHIAQVICGISGYVDSSDSSTTINQTQLDTISLLDTVDVSGKRIANLAGFHHFYNASTLDASNNQLTEIDFSDIVSPLSVVNLSYNQLTILDVSPVQSLKNLSCGNNSLTSIIFDVHPAISSVSCANNNLASLDVASLPSLLALSCANNQLSTLDLSRNTLLKNLTCHDNQLTSIELGTISNLRTIYCPNNQLTELDLSLNPSITDLNCSNNMIEELVIASDYYTSISCYNNRLTSLEFPNTLNNLTLLSCQQNQITSLDLTALPALAILNCSNNDISGALDLSDNPDLLSLDCASNSISSFIGLEDCLLVDEIYCDNNNLTSLDIGALNDLGALTCANNQLTELNLGVLPSLGLLSCSYNQLTELDVSTAVSLKNLHVDNNNLTSLIIPNNPLLKVLNCSVNSLTSLDISNSSDVEELALSFNKLTSSSFLYHSAIKRRLKLLEYHCNAGLSFDGSDWEALHTLGADQLSGETDLSSVGTLTLRGSASPTETGALRISSSTGMLSYDQTLGYVEVEYHYFQINPLRRDGETGPVLSKNMPITINNQAILNSEGILLTGASLSDVQADRSYEKSGATTIYSARGKLETLDGSTISVVGNLATITGGFTITKFEVEGDELVAATSETFQYPSGTVFDLHTFAIEAQKYSLIYEITDENGISSECGTVTGASSGDQIEEDTSVTLTAAPEEGYTFVGWYDADDNLLSRNTINTFTMDENKFFEAHFKETTANQYQLNYSIQGDGVFVDYSHREGTYDKDTIVTLEVEEKTTDDLFIGWYEGSSLVSRSKKYVLKLDHDTSLVAKFKDKAEAPKEDFTLDYRVELLDRTPNVGGSITGDEAGTYESGTTFSITAVPDAGYKFVGWYTADGTQGFDYPTLEMPLTSNLEVVAVFKEIRTGVDEFSFNYSIINPERGSVTGSRVGPYYSGDTISVTAIPKEGSVFDCWRDQDGNVVSWNENYTFVITESTNLNAGFRPSGATYKYSYDIVGNGTISGDSQGRKGANDVVTGIATAGTGYKFVGWYEGNLLLSREFTYSFNINKDIHLTARFKANPPTGESDYKLDYQVKHQNGNSGEGGYVNGTIPGTYDEETSISLTAVTHNDYTFVGWYEGNTLISRNPILEFDIDKDYDLVALFKDEAATDYEFSASSGENGSITSSHIDGLYEEDTEIELVATADTNYAFVGWYEGDTLVSRDAEYTITLDHDTHLVAQFKKITAGVSDYTLDYSSEDPLIGTVGGTPAGTYDEGTEITVEATIVDTDYKFVGWFDENGKVVSWSQSYTFNISKDTNLTARFKLDEDPIVDYRYSFEALGGADILSSVPDGLYNSGTSITLQQPPGQDYRIASWSVNGTIIPSFTESTYTFTLNENTHIVVTYDIIIYEVTVQIQGNGNVTGGGFHNEGSQVTLTATPGADSSFVHYWDPVNDQLISENPEYVITNLQETRTILAVFVKDKYILTVEVSEGGVATPGGAYEAGSDIPLMAVANPGYVFVGWYTSEYNIASAAPGYTFENIQKDTTLIAIFKVITVRKYSVNVTVDGNGSFVFEGGNPGPFYEGQNVTLVASYVSGSSGFLGWYDSDTSTWVTTGSLTYTIYNLQRDVNLVARFVNHDISNYWIVHVERGGNGSGRVNGYTGKAYDYYVEKGQSITLTAVAGYESIFGGYFEDVTLANQYSSNLVYTFTPTEDTFIFASFTSQFIAVRSIATTGGQAGFYYEGYNYSEYSNRIKLGSEVTFWAYNTSTHKFYGWYDFESQQFLSYENEYVVSNLLKDITLYAIFRPNEVVPKLYVSVIIQGLGTVTGSGMFDYGSEVTLTATPSGAEVDFLGWFIESTLLSQDLVYVIDELTQNLKIRAMFSYYDDPTILSAMAIHDVNDPNSSDRGNVYGSYNGVAGGSANFRAYPYDNYVFDGWFDEDDDIVSTLPDYTFVVTRDLVYTAKFTRTKFTINAEPAQNGTLKINGNIVDMNWSDYENEVNYRLPLGSDVIVDAIPDPGYELYGWAYYNETSTAIEFLGPETHLEFLDNHVDIMLLPLFTLIKGYHNITADVDGNGSVIGEGIYQEGSHAILYATADEDNKFVGWYDENDNLLGSNYYYLIDPVNQDVHVIAKFEEDLNPPETTKYEVTSNIIGLGSVDGTGTYDAGTNVILTATAAEGYKLDGWYTEDGVLLGIFDYYIIYDLMRDTEITARFSLIVPPQQYDVTVTKEGEGTVTGDGTHFVGQNVILEATPDEVWEFAGWYDSNDQLISDEEIYIIYNLSEDINIRAVFTKYVAPPSTYELVINTEGYGTVTGAGTYPMNGSEVTVTAEAAENWEFVGWYDDLGHLVSEDEEYTLKNNKADDPLILTAKFEQVAFNVYIVETEGGTTTGEGTYNAGEDATLVATADAGYEFVGWYTDSGSILSDKKKYVLEDINEDIKIRAVFKAKGDTGFYKVDVSVEGNGSVTGAGYYLEDENVFIIATPDDGYKFAGYYDGETLIGLNYYAYIVGIDRDYDLIAKFEEDLDPPTEFHVVSVEVQGGMANVVGDGSYADGTNAFLYVEPSAGYQFVEWQIEGVAVGNKEYYIINELADDVHVVAVVEPIVSPTTYHVEVIEVGGGTVTGDGTFYEGQNVILEATPMEGWYFAGYRDPDDDMLCEESTYIIRNLSDHHEIFAVFKQIEKYTVTLTSANSGGAGSIVIPGSGTYDAGTVVKLTATPDPISIFGGWYDSELWNSDPANSLISSDLEYTFTINKNTKILYSFLSKASNPHNLTYEVQMQDETVPPETLGFSGTKQGYHNHNTAISVSAVNNDSTNYEFVAWYYSDYRIASWTTSVTGNLTEDTHLIAMFKPIAAQNYTFRFEQGDNGILSASRPEGIYAAGTEITLIASPEPGYAVDVWYVNGAASAAFGQQLEPTLTLNANTTVSIAYARTDYTVSLSVEGNGTVFGAGTYATGSDVTLYALPDAGYEFDGWYDSEDTLVYANATYKIEDIDDDYTLVAKFEQIAIIPNYTVTIKGDGGGSPSGDGEYPEGTEVTLKANPGDLYEFIGWHDENDHLVSEQETYVIDSLEGDMYFFAKYEKVRVYVKLHLYGNGDADGEGMFDIGDDVTLTATPDAGWQFVGWYDYHSQEMFGEEETLVIENIQLDYGICAIFERIDTGVYEVDAVIEGNGSVEGTGTFAEGSVVVLVAHPDAGQKFVGWYTEDDAELSTELYYIINSLDEDVTVVAKFEEDLDLPTTTYEVTADIEGMGSVIGQGTYTEGSNIILFATPDAGYEFVGWYDENDQYLRDDIYIQFNDLSDDINVRAVFKLIIPPETFDVTVTVEGDGSVTGDGTHNVGQNVVLEATPDAGYQFEGWYDENDQLISSELILIIKDLQEDREITAVFTEIPVPPTEYEVVLNVEGGGSVTGDGFYEEGTDVDIGAKADEHYVFEGWWDKHLGGYISYDENYTILDLSYDRDLTAWFTKTSFDVIVNVNGAGSVTGDGTFVKNASTTLVATADLNHEFVGWYDEDGRYLGDSEELLVNNIVADHEYQAVFKEKVNTGYHDVLVVIDGDGSVFGGGTHPDGSAVVLIATPDDGNVFEGWYDENDTVISDRYFYIIDPLTEDVKVKAKFVVGTVTPPTTTYDVVVNVTGSGTVVGDGTYGDGEDVILLASPDNNNEFVGWFDESDQLVSAIIYYEIEKISEDITLKAVFREIVPVGSYRVEVRVEGEGSVSGDGIYTEGSLVILLANPEDGHKFVGWYDALDQLVSEDYFYIINAIDSDHSYKAVFEEDLTPGTTYEVSVTREGLGNVFGAGSYVEGSNVILVATPEDGYRLSGWFIDDTLVGFEAYYVINNLTEDTEVHAVFSLIVPPETYDVSVTVDGQGSVTGDGTHNVGQNVVLEATPDAGYQLEGWYDENNLLIGTDLILVIKDLQEDRDIKAVFSEIPVPPLTHTIITSIVGDGNVSGETQVVDGGSTTLTATPNTNWEFVGWWADGYDPESATPPYEVSDVLELSDVTSNMTFIAVFEQVSVEIVVQCTEGGSATGAGVYALGAEVELTAIPDIGYEFVGWYDSTTAYITDTLTHTLEAGTDEQYFIAVFKVKDYNGFYDVVVDIEGNGSVTGAGTYEDGAIVVLIATPDADNKFVGWYDEDDNELGTDYFYIINPLVAHTKVIAKFEAGTIPSVNTYDVTTPIEGNGSVEGAGTYEEGSNVILVATPEDGHEFVGWYDESDQLVGSEIYYVINDLSDDTAIRAVFKEIVPVGSYRVEVEIDGDGSVTGAGIYQEGSLVILVATPDAGQEFVGWYDELDQLISEDYFIIIDGIVSDHSYKAVFQEDLTQPAVAYEVTTVTEGLGSVTGEGTYEEGTNVLLVATPEVGYEFVGWYIDGTLVGSHPYYVLDDLSEDTEIRAVFKLIIPPEQYRVDVWIEGDGDVEGDGVFNVGQNIILEAIPDAGNRFVGWFDMDGNPLGTDLTLIIKDLQENINIRAVFESVPTIPDEFKVILNVDGNGSVTGDGTYYEGQTADIKATADPNWEFVGWFDSDGDLYNENANVLINNIVSDITLTAKFVQVAYNVSVTVTEGGSVIGDGSYAAGTDATLVATPEDGYRFVGWYDMDGNIVTTSRKLEITDIDKDHEYQAVFETRVNNGYYDVVVNIDGSGSVTGDGTYAEGSLVILIATADADQEFVGWYDLEGNLLSEDYFYIITSIDADHEIVAVFEELVTQPDVVHEVSTVADGEGTVIGAGIYADGSDVIVVATPEEGWEFVGWYIDGTLVGSEIYYIIENLSDDVEVTAVFKEIVPPVVTYEVEVTVDGNGSVTGAGIYEEGQNVILVATPEDGHEFVGWYDSEGNLLSTDIFYAIMNIHADADIEAVFQKTTIPVVDTYTVIVTNEGNGGVSGAGTYNEGSTVTLVATPDAENEFVGWYDMEGNLISEELEYVIDSIEENVNLVAKFKLAGEGGGENVFANAIPWVILVASIILVVGSALLLIGLVSKSKKDEEEETTN